MSNKPTDAAKAAKKGHYNLAAARGKAHKQELANALKQAEEFYQSRSSLDYPIPMNERLKRNGNHFLRTADLIPVVTSNNNDEPSQEIEEAV